jgi:hypothetical protein
MGRRLTHGDDRREAAHVHTQFHRGEAATARNPGRLGGRPSVILHANDPQAPMNEHDTTPATNRRCKAESTAMARGSARLFRRAHKFCGDGGSLGKRIGFARGGSICG